MTIYLTAPAYSVTENFEEYKKIIKILHSNGHSLTRNWIEPAQYQPQKFGVPADEHERKVTVRHIFESLGRADAVIADISSRGTFGNGYLVATAVHLGKPVLLLQRKGTPEGLLPKGLDDELIHCADFDEGNLAECVVGFLEAVG
jgi:nucleoside 2-deoxyribosyltransferase